MYFCIFVFFQILKFSQLSVYLISYMKLKYLIKMKYKGIKLTVSRLIEHTFNIINFVSLYFFV